MLDELCVGVPVFLEVYMKMLSKIAVSAFVVAGIGFQLPAAGVEDFAGFGNNSVSVVNGGLGDFAESLGKSIPQTAVQQNVYADAYIGNLFPSLPPHFAVGANVGVTHVNTEGIAAAADALFISGVDDSYYFPVFNADIRIGGVFLPFDIGVSFMKFNNLEAGAMDADFSVDFFTVAADVRYALLKDGLICPALSVGVGYSYNSGSFAVSASHAETAVDYDVQTLYAAVQLSKTLNIPVVKIGFTPFVGVRGILSKYSNDWSWKIKGDVASALDALGVSAGGSGTASSDGFGGFQPQIYGGVGINFMLVQITGSICADMRHIGTDDKLWSGAFSLRLKI